MSTTKTMSVIGFFAGVALLLTACSFGNTGHWTGRSSAAATEVVLVAWIDKVCGVALNLTTAFPNDPQFDTSDLATTQRQYADWLGASSSALDQSIEDLKALENGPHPDSKKLVTSIIDIFGQVKAAFDKAKAGIEAANPNDPFAVVAAFTQAGTDLTAITEVSKDFNGVLVRSNLAYAEHKAPKCRKAEAIAAYPTPTPTK
jgi:hypothetical protein